MMKTPGIAISLDGKGPWRDNVFVAQRLLGPSNTERFTCMHTIPSGMRRPVWSGI
jgi:hypothetical protein